MTDRPMLVRPRAAVAAAIAIAMLIPSLASAQNTATIQAPAIAGDAASACTTKTDVAAAAKELFGAGTEVVRVEQVAGLRTALVLEPRIAPGTRRRMLATGTGWCEAASGFNAVWANSTDGAATAVAYASLAAAPYFDDVTVKSVRPTAAGVYVVRTHALTNGVEAHWVIATDAAGVRSATWTATAFGVKPLVGQIEGLTAMPGGTETYTRLADGLLVEKRGLPTAESARRDAERGPSVPHVYMGPDGMEIRLSIGDSHVGIDPDTQTGQTQADTLSNFADAISLNYGEFHDWGLRKGWESDLDPALGRQVGWVYVNNSLSLYCSACVFIADDFQIHMISEINAFLDALGFTGYKNDREALQLVVGHEMFHNFQNAYNNPGPLGRSRGRSVSTAYSEGTARFQETLHSYSDVTFADKTLYTGGQTNPPGLSLDANHCNGYGSTDALMAAGPFPKTYNACYFWTSWFNQNGVDSLVNLVAEGIPSHATKGHQEEGVLAIGHAAPDVPVADQLAFFAHSALTGRNKTITSASGGVERDWGSFLFKWAPRALSPGSSAGTSIGAGGVFGRQLTTGAKVSLSGAGLALYEIRSTDLTSSTTPLDPAGADVAAPAEGESVWVVAVNPTVAAVTGTIAAQ